MTSPLPLRGASERASEEGGARDDGGDVDGGAAQILKHFVLFNSV